MAVIPRPRSGMPAVAVAPRSLLVLLLLAASLLILADIIAGNKVLPNWPGQRRVLSPRFTGSKSRSLAEAAQASCSKLPNGKPCSVALTQQGAAAQGPPSSYQNAGASTSRATAAYQTSNASIGIWNQQNGPVLNKPISIYIAWVGSFPETRKQLLRDFVSSLNPQTNASVTVDDWWNTSTLYWGGTFSGSAPTAGWVSSTLTIKGERDATAKDLASWGVSSPLQEYDPWTIVANSITDAAWPVSPAAAYFAFTNESYPTVGACSYYCGWHGTNTFQGVPLVYSWVGALPCKANCWASALMLSRSDGAMQAAISVWAHEMTEMASDPYISSWYDDRGYENADKCAWNFGTNGAWNLAGLRSTKFLVQKNWNPQTGACTLGPGVPNG